MDWPRVKNILIISFLILNLLLVFRLYVQPNYAFPGERLSEESMDAIVEVLKQNGVTINTALPRVSSRRPAINISLHAYSAEEIAQMRTNILGPLAPQDVAPEDEQYVFTLDNELLIITSRGYVTYIVNDPDPDPDPVGSAISETEAKAIANEFMGKKLGNPKNFVFDGISFTEGMGYLVDYVQTHNNSSMFDGYITMVVKPSGVARMWLCQLDISSKPWGGKDVLTPHEALLKLHSHRVNSGETDKMEVLRVDLGYYGSIYDSDQAWEAVPVWRIYTSVGDFKVNALSGIIEQ